MKPPSFLPPTFGDTEVDDAEDFTLDALFEKVRQPSQADVGAAERFLSRQALTLPEVPPSAQTLPKRRAMWWPTLLAAAALFGGVLVLRPTPSTVLMSADSTQTLASNAAYDAYNSALGGEW